MSDSEIGISRQGATLHLRLQRPAKRNAITSAMYAAMADALEAAADDGQTCAAIVSSEGGTFCAGNDLADFMTPRPGTPGAEMPVHRFLRAIATTPLVLMAAVQGQAVGIGTTLLLHCDFAFAEPDAVLQMPFVDLALVPEAASSLLLPRLLGRARASALLLAGEKLDAARAESWGLVTRMVGAGEARAEAERLAASLAAKPRDALRQAKRLMKLPDEGVAARMAEENAAFAAQLATPEFAAIAQRFFATRARAA